ncbi:Hypothetical predicted protein [Mytilus galloprovincialis]|uniref:MACPF domain-containing protein n=1 Tax=Mytilus galloprovincialis TaxID=29158 RepID=A0A8B6DGX6_MYTGA|nr:Hypothetical predicted protein [Mytilus galloprovincialis]
MELLQVLLVFFSLLSPGVLRSIPCTNVPPFLYRLRDGVDLTKLDLLPLDVSGNDGFRYPVIDFTCNHQKRKELNGKTYNIPDQIWNIVNIPNGLLDTYVEIHKNSHSFKKSMSARVDVGLFKGLFSSSVTYTKMQQYFQKASKYVEDLTSQTAGYKINMIPEWGLEFGRVAKMYIDRLLPETLNDKSIKKYMKFIDTFGTHYFNHGRFGGILRLLLATDASYFEKKTEKRITLEAKSLFKKILKIGGKSTTSTKIIDTKFTNSTRNHVRYYGGKTNLLAAGGISTWIPTVLDNPWLYGGGMREISDLIVNDNKRQSMKRAVQIYTDKAYLHELLKDIHVSFIKNKKENYMTMHSMLLFENKLRLLLQNPIPTHSEIMEISRMMSPTPDWFKQMKLCSKNYLSYRTYRPDGIYYSCSNVYNRTISITSRTGLKKSDKVYSNSMGLISFGNEKWFENVELCFRLRNSESNKNGKCAYERQITLCTKLNLFTSNYSITTDSNCRIQWMLSIPTDAPFWIQGTQICVWYDCYSLGRRSKLIKKYVRCAHPNKYTYDNPYSSTFKCSPKLGILPNNREII